MTKLWTYNHERPNMGSGGITPAIKLKMPFNSSNGPTKHGGIVGSHTRLGNGAISMTTKINGYLDESVGGFFKADLYIAAMGRSGSTWLSNMLTTTPTHWVMVEPWFVNGVTSKNICEKAAEFGIPTDGKFWVKPPTCDEIRERYENFLNPHLRKLEKWGVKEVRGDFHQPTILTIRPKKVIVLVRNIKDVALSLMEKWILQGSAGDRGPDWVYEYCEKSSTMLLKLYRPSDEFSYEKSW